MRAFAIALLLLAAACAPRVMPAGPATGTPAIAADSLVMPDGARLPLRAWRPEGAPRGVVLALHGFNDTAENFLHEGGPLLARGGLLVYAYDQRGFGRAPGRGIWPGTESLLADLDAATRLIAARHRDVPLFRLGESMGAALLLLAGTRDAAPPVAGDILLAPGLWPSAELPGFARATLWLAAHTMPAVSFRQGFGGIQASDNLDALRRFASDPWTIKDTRVDAAFGVVGLLHEAADAVPRCCTRPTLILYGARDRVIAGRPLRAALAELPPEGRWRFGLHEQGWHLLLRDGVREAVAHDILAWTAAPASPLSDGVEAAGRRFLTEPLPR
jgi:alpha-beta hydrolase superfamily lysophospholipase